jgi:hypothetical protein
MHLLSVRSTFYLDIMYLTYVVSTFRENKDFYNAPFVD